MERKSPISSAFLDPASNPKNYTQAAASVGYAAVYDDLWFHLIWPHWVPCPNPSIAWLEIIRVHLACLTWENSWSGKWLVCYADSSTAAYVWQYFSSRHRGVMENIRKVYFLALQENVVLEIVHISSVPNVLGDRFYQDIKTKRFFSTIRSTFSSSFKIRLGGDCWLPLVFSTRWTPRRLAILLGVGLCIVPSLPGEKTMDVFEIAWRILMQTSAVGFVICYVRSRKLLRSSSRSHKSANTKQRFSNWFSFIRGGQTHFARLSPFRGLGRLCMYPREVSAKSVVTLIITIMFTRQYHSFAPTLVCWALSGYHNQVEPSWRLHNLTSIFTPPVRLHVTAFDPERTTPLIVRHFWISPQHYPGLSSTHIFIHGLPIVSNRLQWSSVFWSTANALTAREHPETVRKYRSKESFCGNQSALLMELLYRIFGIVLGCLAEELMVLALSWNCLVQLATRYTIISLNVITLCDIAQQKTPLPC